VINIGANTTQEARQQRSVQQQGAAHKHTHTHLLRSRLAVKTVQRGGEGVLEVLVDGGHGQVLHHRGLQHRHEAQLLADLRQHARAPDLVHELADGGVEEHDGARVLARNERQELQLEAALAAAAHLQLRHLAPERVRQRVLWRRNHASLQQQHQRPRCQRATVRHTSK
jgi:hypothetical protein